MHSIISAILAYINRRQEVDIYYKGIGILEMSKVFDSRQK